MVKVVLRGGLGNQMFQYAAGLRIALKQGAPLVLDTVLLHDRWPRKEFTYRSFDLDIFTLKPEFTRLSRVADALPIPGFWLGLDMASMKVSGILGGPKFLVEKKEHAFDPEVYSATGSVTLFGRWQNPRYFADIEKELRVAFQFKIPLGEEAASVKERIMASESVALCVRRGDYVQHKSAKALMGETNVDYYAKAIAHINEQVDSPRFFVFTDDIEFCKQEIGLPADTVYIGKMGPKWSWHLELMSLCKHSIIANSTFYWWGAWLNPQPEGVVIAPARWYADREEQPGIFPAHWVQM